MPPSPTPLSARVSGVNVALRAGQSLQGLKPYTHTTTTYRSSCHRHTKVVRRSAGFRTAIECLEGTCYECSPCHHTQPSGQVVEASFIQVPMCMGCEPIDANITNLSMKECGTLFATYAQPDARRSSNTRSTFCPRGHLHEHPPYSSSFPPW